MTAYNDLSDEKVAELHTKAAEADRDFSETLERLSTLVRTHDPIEILARLAMTVITGQSRFGTKDYDPLIHVYHVEFFQGMALGCSRQPLYAEGDLSDVASEVVELIKKNAEAFRLRALRTISTSGKANAFDSLIDQVKVTTQTVRGARHAFQTRNYLRDVARKVDGEFKSDFGCTLTSLINFIESIADQYSERLQAFFSAQRPWMLATTVESVRRRFLEVHPDCRSSAQTQRIFKTEKQLDPLKSALWTSIECEYAALFTLATPARTTPEGRALSGLVDQLSMSFGDLTSEQLSQLHLNNPVWRKPFLRLDPDRIFLPNPQSLFSFLIEIIDGLAETHNRLKGKIETHKAEWLEQKLSDTLRVGFPSAKAFSNIAWSGGGGARRETDALILIDQVAAIFEAKSGRVSPPARRGAQDRLKREIKRLIVEPSEQSNALKRLIETAPNVELRATEGVVEIRGPEIRDFIRVNVLFDTIGTISAHWPQLKEHGLVETEIPLAPTMSIFELETVLDALPNEIRRLHYLKRREEIEQRGRYVADELDLLSLYFDTGFSLGKLEFDERGYGIYGYSDKVARNYDHMGRVSDFDLHVKQTPLWKRMIERIDDRKPKGWTRMGIRLCSVHYQHQLRAERELDRAFRKARKHSRPGTLSFGFKDGVPSHPSHWNVLAFCVGNRRTEMEIMTDAHDAGAYAMEQSGADSCLVIYHDVAAALGDYQYIATMKRARGGHAPPLPANVRWMLDLSLTNSKA